MKALAVIAISAFGLMAGAPARADRFGDPAFGFGPGVEIAYRHGVQYPGSASIVAGWGDDDLGERRHYWGGPCWVTCRGNNPPFDTYRINACRRMTAKVAGRDHRPIKARLK